MFYFGSAAYEQRKVVYICGQRKKRGKERTKRSLSPFEEQKLDFSDPEKLVPLQVSVNLLSISVLVELETYICRDV